jgi:hypothetical protein
MFKNHQFRNTFYKAQKFFVSSNRNHTRFDIHIDWMTKFLAKPGLSIARGFALVNVALFLYVNFRLYYEKRFNAKHNTSFSILNLQNKEYIPLFASLLGSYRIDDLVLETGLLWTIGHSLEKMHGRPFVFKLFIFSFYIGMMSSLYWIRKDCAKRERYNSTPPEMRFVSNGSDFRFMSQHNFAMSIFYFYLFKNTAMRYLILPVLGVDMAVWGPYYSAGALTGLAAGMIL